MYHRQVKAEIYPRHLNNQGKERMKAKLYNDSLYIFAFNGFFMKNRLQICVLKSVTFSEEYHFPGAYDPSNI